VLLFCFALLLTICYTMILSVASRRELFTLVANPVVYTSIHSILLRRPKVSFVCFDANSDFVASFCNILWSFLLAV
jgi:hypothetical protein